MIRLVLLLCAGLYVTAIVFGADHGQKRHGLMLANAAPVAAAAPVPQKSVFIPAQPVMQAAPAQVADPMPALQTVAMETAPQADPLPAPEISGGLLYSVAAAQANVRSGPGRSFAVVGRLNKGEQVLVVIEEQPIEGWSRVRIEGDGIEGYVSTRLLTRSE
ncbi:MAG: SH3 domain-containing protein [Pseudorhodobacter sp.]|nr:SH3 domain-containing protein [Pseudorhodobacter sp.]